MVLQETRSDQMLYFPGIGKHGKFYKLTEVQLKDWELEDSMEEMQVTIDKKKDDKC